MSGAVFVEYGTALMFRLPRHGSVNDSFGEEQDISRFKRGLDDIMRRTLEPSNLLRHMGREIALVTPRNAGESASAFGRIG